MQQAGVKAGNYCLRGRWCRGKSKYDLILMDMRACEHCRNKPSVVPTQTRIWRYGAILFATGTSATAIRRNAAAGHR